MINETLGLGIIIGAILGGYGAAYFINIMYRETFKRVYNEQQILYEKKLIEFKNYMKDQYNFELKEPIPNSKQIIFISGPYAGNVDANIHNAEIIARKYWKEDYAVICPHLNSKYFTEGDNGIHYNNIMSGYLEILKRCDYVVFLKDWDKSKGCQIEHDCAIEYNIKRLYL